MLVSSVLLYAVGKGLFGRDSYAMMAKATSVGAARTLPPRRAWLCTALFAGITLVAILPHLGVILVAFSRHWYATVFPRGLTLDNFRLALGHDLTVPAIANSLKYSSVATRGRPRARRGHRLCGGAHAPRRPPGARFPLHAAARRARAGAGVWLPRHEPGGSGVCLPQPGRESDPAAHHRLRRAPACPTWCVRPPPDSSRPARPWRRPRKTSAARRSRRPSGSPCRSSRPISSRAALLAFAFAMLEVIRFAHPRAKAGVLSDHQGHLRTVPIARRRPVPRLRPRGLGDGFSRRDHRRHERPAGPEARGDFQSLTGSRRAAADSASTPAPSAAVNRK